ncbi:unnamed protein product [Ixodes pacificus]
MVKKSSSNLTLEQMPLYSHTLLHKCNCEVKIVPKKVEVLTFSGETPAVTGRRTINCIVHGVTDALELYLVDIEVQPTLGIQTCSDLNLVRRVEHIAVGSSEMSSRPTNSAAILSFPGAHKITFKNDAVSSITAPRKIPSVLGAQVKK